MPRVINLLQIILYRHADRLVAAPDLRLEVKIPAGIVHDQEATLLHQRHIIENVHGHALVSMAAINVNNIERAVHSRVSHNTWIIGHASHQLRLGIISPATTGIGNVSLVSVRTLSVSLVVISRWLQRRHAISVALFIWVEGNPGNQR